MVGMIRLFSGILVAFIYDKGTIGYSAVLEVTFSVGLKQYCIGSFAQKVFWKILGQ